MYLNVSLPLPTSGGVTCPTPKTPEILNSLISLSSQVQRSSQLDSQGSISDASPHSDSINPFEEYPSYVSGGSPLFHGQRLTIDSSPVYKMATKQLDCVYGMGDSSIGTPSPPVPELPSPVQPVEATKTALIKSGLKYQIQSKLCSAGLTSPTDFPEQKAFKEELTIEDEDRRMRRRERNKVAATKCRNKKKERTSILVNESEEVEGENLKLKSEIQRLRSEKLKLENLLEDPKHISCCQRIKIDSPQRPTQGSVSQQTSVKNVPSCRGQYMPNTVDIEPTGMSYTTLSYPSPTSYIYKVDKTNCGTSGNKPSSKFGSFLATTDAINSEVEENYNMPLTSLPIADLNDLNPSDNMVNTTNFIQFPQCEKISPVSERAGTPITSISSLESHYLSNSLNNEIQNIESGLFTCENTFKSGNIENSNENNNLMPLNNIGIKMSKTARFCPYDRRDVNSELMLEYTDCSLANNYRTNSCGQNPAVESNQQFSPPCTYGNI